MIVAIVAEVGGSLLTILGVGGPIGRGLLFGDMLTVTLVIHWPQSFWVAGGKAGAEFSIPLAAGALTTVALLGSRLRRAREGVEWVFVSLRERSRSSFGADRDRRPPVLSRSFDSKRRRPQGGAHRFPGVTVWLWVQIAAVGVRGEAGIRDRQRAQDQVDARPEPVWDRQVEAG